MEWTEKLKEEIEELKWIIPDKIGVVFSGGLDSSFLAYLANMWDKDVHLYSAGTRDSGDIKWVSEAAELLGLPLKFIIIDEKNILEGIREIKRIDRKVDALGILFDLPLYFSSKNSDNKFLVSGQGSDELFMGYKKYEITDTHLHDLKKLIEKDLPREIAIVKEFDRTLLTPYLTTSFMELALKIPSELKIQNGIHKKILREVALEYGLNKKIALRPKKSAQYSSGVRNLVDELASQEGKKVYEFIRDL